MALRSASEMLALQPAVDPNTARRATLPARRAGSTTRIFNNAGVTLIATFEHSTIEEIDWLLGINLWGVIYGTKAFLPMMLEQRSGCIVNLSSIFRLVGVPTQSAYNMSKFAVRGLTESLWRWRHSAWRRTWREADPDPVAEPGPAR
jgi:NAD(P)-dependent dehydrogenase (short-subunit alcohol dehydrogenase family)